MQSRTDPTERADARDYLTLGDLLRTVLRGWWIVLLCTAVATAIGVVQAFRLAVPSFNSTASMVLQVDAPPLVDFDAVLSGGSADAASLNTEMEIIRSRTLVGRLVQELDLVADPEFNEQLDGHDTLSFDDAITFAKDLLRALPTYEPSDLAVFQTVVTNVTKVIQTRTQRDSYVFRISATTRDPDKSARIVNTLARIYQEDQIAEKADVTEAAMVWLSEQVGELEVDLSRQLAEASNFRSQSGLVSAEALEALGQQSIELRSELQSASATLGQEQQKLARLRIAESGDFADRAAASEDPGLSAMAVALAQQQNPQTRVRFDRRFTQVVLQAQTNVDRVERLVERLRSDLAQLSAEFDEQSAFLSTLQELERNTQATQVLYETFLGRLKEISVQEGFYQADSRILSPALPGRIVAPRRSVIVAVAILLGFLAGAAIVILRELSQSTYRRAEELEAGTGQVVLGQIPRIPRRGRRKAIDYLTQHPTSAVAEAVRNLRTSILMARGQTDPKVIMITSSIPGEGKTTVSIALAHNLAGLRKKVLLIEGDIRRRTFATYFPKAPKDRGLNALLEETTPLAEAVIRDAALGIDVLMGQKPVVNAADLFSSDRFGEILSEARRQYDYVIVDTPPVLVVSDARVIATQADAVVYAVGWDRTSRAQVSDGLRSMETAGLDVTGLVLTKISPRGMRSYGYGGVYGRYSGYGKGYYAG